MKKVVLKNKRVTLRPYKLADAPIFLRWFQNKNVIKYLMAPPPKNLKEELSFVRKSQRRKNGFNFSVINEAGVLVGSVGVGFDTYEGTATIGVLIGEEKEWGKGYATEAIQTLTKLAFDNKKIHRVQLQTAVENKRAHKLYSKLRFKTEGILRQSSFNPILKKSHDMYVMSMLRKEFKNFE